MYNISSSYYFQTKPFCKFLNSGFSNAGTKPNLKMATRQLSTYRGEGQALINKAYDEIDFSINPNPAKSVITLTQKGDFKLIQISEMSGKIVFESVLNTNENSQTFELSHLSNGIYMITLLSDFKTVRTKLIIKK